MKLIFCVTLSYVLCNFGVFPAALDSTKKLEKSDEGESKTTITGLNEDCLHLVLEHFDFDDLLNMAQINDEFSIVAAAVFRSKFSHLQILMRNDFPLPDNPNELLNVAGMEIDAETIERVNKDQAYLFNEKPRVIENQIHLKNGDQVLNTFKHFGHEIRKMAAISFSENGTVHTELIGRLIDKYSCESLTDVEIGSNAETVLKHIKKPLINVGSVSFRGIDKTINSTCFNELFPAVRRLILNSLNDDCLAYFNHHIPHLQHVTMHVKMRGITEHIDSNFLNIFVKNPQILSVDFQGAYPVFVGKVNTLLTKLETITISSFRVPDGHDITFKNVTTFALTGKYVTPKNMHFPQLETFQVEYISNHMSDYLEFLDEHTHLTHLHLVYFMLDANFPHFTADLPNLLELTLDQQYKVPALASAVIVNFVRSHDNVQKLNIINFTEDQQAELQERLEDEWDFSVDGAKVSFQRKTNDEL